MLFLLIMMNGKVFIVEIDYTIVMGMSRKIPFYIDFINYVPRPTFPVAVKCHGWITLLKVFNGFTSGFTVVKHEFGHIPFGISCLKAKSFHN